MKSHHRLFLGLLAVLVATAVYTLNVQSKPDVKPPPAPLAVTAVSPAEIDCPILPDPAEIEGETVKCGTVTVPEDYTKPNGRQIDLVYALLKANTLSPVADPVVYLHGGPGAAELRSLDQMTERFAPIRETRDVIIFDQRGAGFSNNSLACDVEYATQQDEVREAFRAYAGDGRSADEELIVNRTLYATCLQRFEEIGADLSQYNTLNNAQDVITIVKALGYEGFNLYGFSYGTQVALEILRRHPDNVRSVILDSAAPADLKLYEKMVQANEEAITSLSAICEADAECSQAYPDLQTRFVALLEQLNETSLETSKGELVTPAVVVGALRQSEIRPGLGDYVPLMIWELEQGKTDTLEAINDNLLPPALPPKTPPEALRYTGLKLSPEAQFLVDSGLNVRQEAANLDKLADQFLDRADAQIALDGVGSTPAARFDLLFHELMAEEPLDRRLALNQAYLELPVQDPTLAGLQAFVDNNFQGVSGARLTEVVESMSETDVADLADIIFNKARDYAQFFNVSLILHLYTCQEHLPYNTLAGAVANYEALAIPQVAEGKLRTVQNLFTTCELFPTGIAVNDFHEPVTSEVPTLILHGTADTQTAVSWGEHVAQSLENSQLVIFPETGHGTIKYSQCAQDIGAAFFNNPAGQLNTNCTEGLLPQFVLPATE